jgi:hypothetical protein
MTEAAARLGLELEGCGLIEQLLIQQTPGNVPSFSGGGVYLE